MVAVSEIWQNITEFIEHIAAVIGGAVGLGYDTAPALIFGLAVIAALPALMIGGMLLRLATPEDVRTSRVRKTEIVSGSPDAAGSTRRRGGSPVFAEAAISVEQDGGETQTDSVYRFAEGEMIMRIGREADNDLRLEHPTVHRYHAMVQRDLDEGYLITDLANPSGNGVFVNGKRVSHGRLADGDEISLGEARLRFEIVG